MKLSNVAITSVKLYREYFSFEQVVQILREDYPVFAAFQKEVLPRRSAARLLDLDEEDVDLKDLLDAPEDCAYDCPRFFARRGRGGVGVLCKAVAEHCSKAYGEMRGAGLPGEWMDAAQMQAEVVTFLQEVTEAERRTFSEKDAVTVLAYLLLHLQIGITPQRADSRRQLSALLETQTERERTILLEHCGMELDLGPIYKGEKGEPDPMEIVEFIGTKDYDVAVRFSDCVLRRDVRCGERLYAIRKGERYVSFLPRFVPVGDAVLHTDRQGRLCMWNGEQKIALTAAERYPANWAHERENGSIFVLDQEGTLDEETLALQCEAEQPVASVSALVDYCLLLADGGVEASFAAEGWKDLLHVSVGLNNAIAIRCDRKPVLADGTLLEHADTVEAQTYEEHYICLSAQGRIATDSGLQLEDGEKALAIAICEEGYVVALLHEVRLYGFDTHNMRRFHKGAREIAASESAFFYKDDAKGEICAVQFDAFV